MHVQVLKCTTKKERETVGREKKREWGRREREWS